MGLALNGHAGFAEHYLVEMLLVHFEGHLIYRGHVDRLDYGIRGHVAEKSDFATHVDGNVFFGAEHEDVGLDAHFLQFLHRVLRGLGFQFLCSGDVGHIGEVDAEAVLAKFPTELAHGFEIGKRLDVADSAADFSDDEIEIAGVAEQLYVSLDFVGDMRHNLYGLAKIVAATFLIDNALIDTSGGDVVGACGLD